MLKSILAAMFLAFALVQPAVAQPVIGPEMTWLARAGFKELTPVPKDDANRQVLAADFEQLLGALQGRCDETDVSLVVVAQPLVASSSRRLVVMGSQWAALPAVLRRFTMAHELGHVCERHKTRVDDYVLQAHLNGATGRDIVSHPQYRGLRHEVEFEADAFATRLLVTMGDDASQGASYILWLQQRATLEHPAPEHRVARVQALAASLR